MWQMTTYIIVSLVSGILFGPRLIALDNPPGFETFWDLCRKPV
jgi:hypothetical protein